MAPAFCTVILLKKSTKSSKPSEERVQMPLLLQDPLLQRLPRIAAALRSGEGGGVKFFIHLDVSVDGSPTLLALSLDQVELCWLYRSSRVAIDDVIVFRIREKRVGGLYRARQTIQDQPHLSRPSFFSPRGAIPDSRCSRQRVVRRRPYPRLSAPVPSEKMAQ